MTDETQRDALSDKVAQLLLKFKNKGKGVVGGPSERANRPSSNSAKGVGGGGADGKSSSVTPVEAAARKALLVSNKYGFLLRTLGSIHRGFVFGWDAKWICHIGGSERRMKDVSVDSALEWSLARFVDIGFFSNGITVTMLLSDESQCAAATHFLIHRGLQHPVGAIECVFAYLIFGSLG